MSYIKRKKEKFFIILDAGMIKECNTLKRKIEDSGFQSQFYQFVNDMQNPRRSAPKQIGVEDQAIQSPRCDGLGTPRREHLEKSSCPIGMTGRKSLLSAKAATSSRQQAGFPEETETSFINLADKM